MNVENSWHRSVRLARYALALAAATGLAAIAAGTRLQSAQAAPVPATRLACDAGNGGITLPSGFCATVFADNLGGARHPAVAANGDIYIALQTRRANNPAGGVVVLRDTDKDGRADKMEYFGPFGGGGIAIRGNYLFLDAKTAILRYTLSPGVMVPAGSPDTVVSGFPTGGNHTSRDVELDGHGSLFVNVGSATNACQEKDRAPLSKGLDPCVELETRAGIWKFSDSQLHQKFSTAARYVTGIRNAVGLAWNTRDGALYATQHGRDNFFQSWPALYTAKKSAENPAEELVKADAGSDFGWPYCYYDNDLKRLVLAAEYGGDAKSAGRCSGKKAPLVAFPGHWAPNALAFYTGAAFPARYRDGAFIAFHGSWNRAPLPQAGYRVVFAPSRQGKFDGTYETFANNFAGTGTDLDSGPYRPTGLVATPDGALLITDDKAGRVWRVTYTSSAK